MITSRKQLEMKAYKFTNFEIIVIPKHKKPITIVKSKRSPITGTIELTEDEFSFKDFKLLNRTFNKILEGK